VTFRVGKAGDDALEPASLLASEMPSDGVTVPEGPSEAVGEANAFCWPKLLRLFLQPCLDKIEPLYRHA